MFSVLLVDDEPDLLEVAKLHLERSGPFMVDTCLSAVGALSSMKKKEYDALIVDYSMPSMNGLDLLKELKARGDGTPVIMLSGTGYEKVVIDALNHGVAYYVIKGSNLDAPFDELQEKLHLAVKQKQTNRNQRLFSAVTRHDLLNKISALSGYVELVKAHTDDTKIMDYMKKQERIITAIQEQMEFIEDYEKLGTRKPCWQPLILTLRKAGSLLPAEGITLVTDRLEHAEIFADPLLEKVFYNLADNSICHGRHVTRITIHTEHTGSVFRIIYEDNGVGIPVADKETIFLRGRGKNTGLGLFLIREILGTTGITIRENGEQGRGARFEIDVPDQRFRVRE